MKKQYLSLADIQKISLDILGIVDCFCQKHNINYSLGYGGLIGAIRHKGCIPWDDDIDIIMPRPDYDRFIRLFNEEGFGTLKLYAPELGNSYYNISRICDMSKTRVEKYYQWTDEDTGVWIDLFPIDGTPIDGGVYLRKISNACFNACGAKTPFSINLSLKRNIKNFVKHILYWNLDRKSEIDKYLAEVKDCVYDTAFTVCNLASPYGKKDTHKKDVFSSYIRIVFDGVEVSIVEKYDEYLSNIYGDYMTPPPKEKQVRGHSDNKYYWI